MVVCTNTLLDVKSNDDGTWRRIRVCDFMSKFADDVISPEFSECQYVFPKDKTLKEKMPSWRAVLMHMLVERAFKTNGLVQDVVKAKYMNTALAKITLHSLLQKRLFHKMVENSETRTIYSICTMVSGNIFQECSACKRIVCKIREKIWSLYQILEELCN